MRRLVLILVVIPFYLSAQYLLPTNAIGDVVFMNTIKAEGYSKDVVFDKCLEWSRKVILAPGDTTISFNKSTGKITGKGRSILSLYLSPDKFDDGVLNFEFSIQVYDNKYQYTFYGISWTHGIDLTEIEYFKDGSLPYQLNNRNTINYFFNTTILQNNRDNFQSFTPSVSTATTTLRPYTKNELINLSGESLRKAGICYTIAMTSMIIAHLSAVALSSVYPDATIIVAGSIALFGVVEIFIGSNHLIKSGNLLKDTSRNNLSLRLKPDKVSLCLSL